MAFFYLNLSLTEAIFELGKFQSYEITEMVESMRLLRINVCHKYSLVGWRTSSTGYRSGVQNATWEVGRIAAWAFY